MKNINLIYLSILTIFVVLFADQALKLWIKSSFELSSVVADWGVLKFQFVENPGMAFGLSFDNSWSKYLLSLFRVFAVIAIGWYIIKLVKHSAHVFFICLVSLIFSGAVGNIIDNLFYGLIFDSGTTWSPEYIRWLPYAGISNLSFDGYGNFLNGCVVDMFHLYLPWPDWIPFDFGEEIFPPVFNLADASISVSVFFIVIFYKKIVRKDDVEFKWSKGDKEAF